MIQAILRWIKPPEATPPPPIPEGLNIPSDSDLRWAKQQTEMLLYRAQQLDIEVDLSQEVQREP